MSEITTLKINPQYGRFQKPVKPWTKEEKAALNRGLEELGTLDWAAIAEIVGTRSPEECEKRHDEQEAIERVRTKWRMGAGTAARPAEFQRGGGLKRLKRRKSTRRKSTRRKSSRRKSNKRKFSKRKSKKKSSKRLSRRRR